MRIFIPRRILRIVLRIMRIFIPRRILRIILRIIRIVIPRRILRIVLRIIRIVIPRRGLRFGFFAPYQYTDDTEERYKKNRKNNKQRGDQ